MVQDCLNGLFRPPWIQLGCKGNPCETDLILMRSIRHAAVHLPIGGKDLAEKRWTENDRKVLHRHGVFGRLLVYPIEIVCQSGNENDPPAHTDANDPEGTSVSRNWSPEAHSPAHAIECVSVDHFLFL